MSAKKKNSDFQPTKHFVLNEICLWTTSLSRENDYDPGKHDGKCSAQTYKRAEPSFYQVNVEGEDDDLILLRVLVDLGVRTVFKGGDDSPGEEIIFQLEAVFAAEYFVTDPPSAEDFKAFVEFNCVHNVWPFWRQHVYDTLKRASLPVPTIPLYAGRNQLRPKKYTRKKLVGSRADVSDSL
ncbi:hypothetical protein FHY17_003306 [Xanthomonas arboricola]|uniref:protein-export chaperone SecB n=1 Tax=Xanthomonas arboricola TaxID=56448 RepID=UPI0016163FD0|nr:protein-export chaperone SecB [Xanthomonas arboricola]MBB3799030.1 hypothetical protein [Xanthomonas arboricola]